MFPRRRNAEAVIAPRCSRIRLAYFRQHIRGGKAVGQPIILHFLRKGNGAH